MVFIELGLLELGSGRGWQGGGWRAALGEGGLGKALAFYTSKPLFEKPQKFPRDAVSQKFHALHKVLSKELLDPCSAAFSFHTPRSVNLPLQAPSDTKTDSSLTFFGFHSGSLRLSIEFYHIIREDFWLFS